MVFEVAQPKSTGSEPDDALYFFITPHPNHLFRIEKKKGGESEALTISDFLESFPVEEVSAENLPFSLNRASVYIAKNTRRGMGNHIFYHPEASLSPMTTQESRYGGRFFPCEHLRPDEYFVTYANDLMDRGWVVLEDGRILKNDNWNFYGARVRVVTGKPKLRLPI